MRESTMDTDASTGQNTRSTTGTDSGFAAVGGANAAGRKKRSSSKPKSLPKIKGVEKHLLPIVSTQRVIFGTTMIRHARIMLKLVREIRGRQETRAELERTFVDSTDIDPETGKGKVKKFIPNNLRRQKMPLNHSK